VYAIIYSFEISHLICAQNEAEIEVKKEEEESFKS